jgi:small ligand-binding sensory domain FIST
MQRNIDFAYIQPQVNKLMSKLGNRKPVLAFYIDCLGRVSGFSGLPQEESREVIKALGDIPFFGMFSGVEIANVGDNVNALDWTGVLCIFSEE